ncbi:unnamed protein product, partial [Amoebophrya sp. A25]
PTLNSWKALIRKLPVFRWAKCRRISSPLKWRSGTIQLRVATLISKRAWRKTLLATRRSHKLCWSRGVHGGVTSHQRHKLCWSRGVHGGVTSRQQKVDFECVRH